MQEYIFTIKNLDKEGVYANIDDREGNTLKWPQNKIPEGLKEGDDFYITVSKEKHKKAKDILNEILNKDGE